MEQMQQQKRLLKEMQQQQKRCSLMMQNLRSLFFRESSLKSLTLPTCRLYD